jgi:hypothetical protein
MGVLKRISVYLAIIGIITSCANTVHVSDSGEKYTKKEIRKINRATRKVEKAKKIWPDIVKGRVEMVKVDITTPQITGQIVTQPEPGNTIYQPGDTVVKTALELPAKYEVSDAYVDISITINSDGTAKIDYKIKEREIEADVPVLVDSIQPVDVEIIREIPWYGYLLFAVMLLVILLLAVPGR